MMRLSLLIFIMLPFLLHAAEGDTLNRVDSLGRKQGYWKITPAMSKQFGVWDLNAIAEEGKYVDGKKEGIWIQYYPNGNVRSRIQFVNNRPSGQCVLYYENGNVSETGTWKRSHWVGEYRSYYENDTLHQLLHFDSLGQRAGQAIYYYPNGKKMVEAYYKAGKEDSTYREHYDNGSLRRELYYKNGVVDPSKTKTYNPPPGAHWPEDVQKRDGKQYHPVDPEHKEIYFNAPDPNRKDYIYDEKGRLIQIKVYKDGKYVGDEPLPEDENR